MPAARLRSHFATKLGALSAMAVFIVVPYFGLQRWRPFPPQAPLVTRLDAWIPFEPAWAPAYLSVCLLVPLFPFLSRRREDVLRYVRGIVVLCLPCFVCFLFFPMPGPRPEVGVHEGAYGWLVGVDETWNAFPSLHAALVLYSFLYGRRAIGADLTPRTRAVFATLSALWGAAILWGTLATKQHWIADLPPAFVLALLADHLAWRKAKARDGAGVH